MDALEMAVKIARMPGLSYGKYMALRHEIGRIPLNGDGQTIPASFVTCEICGRHFQKSNRGRIPKTCSDKCALELNRKSARELYWKKRNEQPVKTKNCVICGKEFQCRRTRQITCSEECSIKRRMWREEQYEMRKMSK